MDLELVLRLSHATFAYAGGQEVLRDLSLTLHAGEVLCILGPNGCGKTTLLRCLCGMLNLTAGETLLNGRDLRKWSRAQIAALVGYIPQETTVPFPYTVRQIVVMGRAPYLGPFSAPSNRDLAIAEEALQRVGIAHLAEKRYTETSGGEQQLALIARVLAQQPRILLLDEPTSHLDFRNQAVVLDLISRLARQGLAVAMTSHSPNQALSYASRVALMNEGAFFKQGAPEDVVTEANLWATYRVEARIFTVDDPRSGRPVRFCMPTLSGGSPLESG
jgi:ABC-type cobalamin/Fe3+-siderophores transport system ATPase subunit